MGLYLPKKEYDDIEWSKPDRQPNVVHGYNHDRKCKVVKIGMQTPEAPTGLITLKQDSKKPVEFEMKSFTRNYYNRLTTEFMSVRSNVFGTTGGAGYLNIRYNTGSWDVAGVYYSISTLDHEVLANNGWSSSAGNIEGIIIGSGNGAFSFEDYVLATYTHGYAGNNIYYTNHTPFTVSVSGEIWTINHSRFFDNFSGASISDINEVGIYLADQNNLDERSVLASPITLVNKEGLRVRYQRDFTIPSVNWTRNAYNIWLNLACLCGIVDSTFGAGLRSLKDTGGTVKGQASSGVFLWNNGVTGYGYNEGVNLSTYGILVGTGSGAESLEDYALTTKAHSAAFTYAANSRLTTSYTAGTKTYLTQWSRIVTNVSSGNTAITEIGLVCRLYFRTLNSNILMARKVLASPPTLVNGESLQVIYEISSVYPA